MKQKILSLLDLKAEMFNRPFVVPQIAVAVRDLQDQPADSPVRKYPGDFVLYEIGLFDDTTGLIEAWDKPVRVVGAVDLFTPPSES